MPHLDRHPHGAPSWVDLVTNDNDAAKKFYGDLFGWVANDQPMDDTGESVYTMYQLDGRNVAASFGGSDEMLQGGPSWQCYFTVDDAEAAAEKVRRAGGEVVAEPFDVFDSGRMLTAMDPTGARFQLWQAKSSIGAETMDEPGSIGWFELMTTDKAKALKFYEQILGAESEILDRGPAGGYGLLSIGGEQRAGMMQMGEEMQGTPSFWTPYFGVADIDASIEKAKSMGGSDMFPKMDIDMAWIAGLNDPQGAYFAIIQLKE